MKGSARSLLRISALAALIGLVGCTTTDAYNQYRKEFKEASVPSGRLQLMTGDPSLSGDLYYIVATNEGDAWTHRIGRSPVRRTAANQELFVLDAKTLRIKPLFAAASKGKVVPDKYQSILCPPAFMSGDLAKVHYSVCTTAFSGSMGHVKWDEMAQTVASLNLDQAIDRIKANDRATTVRAEIASRERAEQEAKRVRLNTAKRLQLLRQAPIGAQVRCRGVVNLSCPGLPSQTSLREFIDAGSPSTGFWQLVKTIPNGDGTADVIYRKVRAKNQPSPSAQASARPRPNQVVRRCVNPATGLQMRDASGSCAGYDVGGSLYGEDNNKPIYIQGLPGFDPHLNPAGPKSFH